MLLINANLQSAGVATQGKGNVLGLLFGLNLDAVPASPGFRVQAVTAGYYGGEYYNAGDVFDIVQASDYSDSTQNYQVHGAEYAPGWMLKAAPSTSLYQWSTATPYPAFPATDPARRFVL